MQTPKHTLLFDEKSEKEHGPVECLGMTFENDEARRAYFTERLREKLQDPEFHKIEGFPIGTDEDILALSDPPYYTACPNPFLPEVLEAWQKERQTTRSQLGLPKQAEQREPFAADVSEGKNDPIYNAHSYHTKVPHKAIMRYILHYTEPGDIVFDGFCGTGMTGVATQLCGSRKEVEALGYQVDEHGMLWDGQKAISHLGARKAVLNDLSPAATFIAYNYNTPVNVDLFENEAHRIVDEVETECDWMYETLHTDGVTKGKIKYTVWSDVFLCNICGSEIIFFNVAIDEKTGKVKDILVCPTCSALLYKHDLKRAQEAIFSQSLGKVITRSKQTPVLINYSVGRERYNKQCDNYDLELIDKTNQLEIPYWFPVDRIDRDVDFWYERDYRSLGIYSLDGFFTPRNLYVLSKLWHRISQTPKAIKNQLRFVFTGAVQIASRMSSFRYDSRNPRNTAGGILKGALYIPSLSKEARVTELFERRFEFISRMFDERSNKKGGFVTLSTTSATNLDISPNCVDYIFTDPPFGSNIIYSDLSIIWEAWLKNYTNTRQEAVVHRRKKEYPTTLSGYQAIMVTCFKETYRVLKPGRWMTIEFHNTQNAIWNAIQEALTRAGFVIADIRTLDKGSGSFKQVNYSSAVKQDLIISAYKPNNELEERFKLEAGTEEGVWKFLHYHLDKLPVINIVDFKLIVNPERQMHLLFDRMVSFHVQRNILVPLSAAEFYAGLSQRFPERDGMFFLPDQVGKYDQSRLQAHQVQQLQLFVYDESSAILWLRQQLGTHPQTYQDLFPKFIREISGWEKQEKVLELFEILEQNFLLYDGAGSIPEQIWSWMKHDEDTHAVVKGQSRENPSNLLRTLAKGRWFIPDPNNAQQLEKVREKALLKEFDSYKEYSGKKLKVFRLEAVRAGFKNAWQDRDYKTIITVAEKISEDALHQDPKLLMWFDQALTRMER